MCILQTPRMSSEIFPGEKQNRDPKPWAAVGNRGQAEDGSEEGAAPWEQDLRYSWDCYGQQQGGGGEGLSAGNNHNLCWKKLLPNFWALHWTSRSVSLVTKGQNSRGDPVGNELFGSLARWGPPPAFPPCVRSPVPLGCEEHHLLPDSLGLNSSTW